jgi:hypothetical protein
MHIANRYPFGGSALTWPSLHSRDDRAGCIRQRQRYKIIIAAIAAGIAGEI